MKTFINNLRREWRCNTMSLHQLCIITAAVWLAAELLGDAFMLIGKVDTYAPVGIIFAYIILQWVALVYGFYYYSIGIELSISMSRTRKWYLPCAFLVAFAQMLCAMALLGILALVSEGIRRLFFAHLSLDLNDAVLPFALQHLHWGLLIIAGALLIGLTIGAGIQRYGSKIFWILWIVYFVPMLFGNSISHLLKSGDTSTLLGRAVNGTAAFLQAIHLPELLPLCTIVFCVVLLSTAVYWLLHATIRQN